MKPRNLSPTVRTNPSTGRVRLFSTTEYTEQRIRLVNGSSSRSSRDTVKPSCCIPSTTSFAIRTCRARGVFALLGRDKRGRRVSGYMKNLSKDGGFYWVYAHILLRDKQEQVVASARCAAAPVARRWRRWRRSMPRCWPPKKPRDGAGCHRRRTQGPWREIGRAAPELRAVGGQALARKKEISHQVRCREGAIEILAPGSGQ